MQLIVGDDTELVAGAHKAAGGAQKCRPPRRTASLQEQFAQQLQFQLADRNSFGGLWAGRSAPAAAQRHIQVQRRVQSRQPQLRELVLRREQRALAVEDGLQVLDRLLLPRLLPKWTRLRTVLRAACCLRLAWQNRNPRVLLPKRITSFSTAARETMSRA